MKKKNIKKNEINIIEILSVLFKNKKLIGKVTGIFILIGLFYSLILTNIYEASSTFYPHYEKIESNSISDLAGLAGINLSNEFSTEVPTSLYPNLISSAPFKNKILNHYIFINNEKILYKDYLLNKQSTLIIKIFDKISKLPYEILNLFRKKNKQVFSENLKFITLSEEDYESYKILDNNISIEVNEIDGYIKLRIRDELPIVAAEIAKISEETLQESIIDYKLKNIRSVYEFTISQLELSKKTFYKLQDSLANFKDRNKNIRSDFFKNQLNRIESEFNIANSIYSELAQNKEKTAIEIQKRTPIFCCFLALQYCMTKSRY